MKKMRRAIQAMACGACLASTQVTLADEVRPGFYLGAGVGNASFDIDKSRIDDANLARFPNPFRVENYRSTLDDGGNSRAFLAGYHFNRYLSVEAGYIDLGSAEYGANADVFFPGAPRPDGLSANVTVDSTGYTLAGLGRLSIGNVFDLHTRVGVLVAQTERRERRRVNQARTDFSESLDSTEAFYSVGAGFNVAQHWSLSVDWTRYVDVGDESDEDPTAVEGIFDVDALSFSAMYRF
jgi:hypothetical protein